MPELKEALSSVGMNLDPTRTPPFEMLVKSVDYQQLAYKAAKAIHDRMLALIGKLTPASVLAKTPICYLSWFTIVVIVPSTQ